MKKTIYHITLALCLLGGIGLNVQQGFGTDVDINELKSVLMKDLYKNNEEKSSMISQVGAPAQQKSLQRLK